MTMLIIVTTLIKEREIGSNLKDNFKGSPLRVNIDSLTLTVLREYSKVKEEIRLSAHKHLKVKAHLKWEYKISILARLYKNTKAYV